MNEKELFKKVIEENLIIKENIRRRVINTVEIDNKKESFFMKKRLVTTVVAVAILCVTSFSAYAAVDAYEYGRAESFLGEIGIEADELARTDAKKVYKDIKSDSFEYSTTVDVLNERAHELGIEDVPTNGKEIYDAIVSYHGLINTAKVTSEQIKSIKSGTTYKDIIKYLGSTKDVGSGLHVLQYAVDGDKILYLSFADENDVCNSSGEDLLKTLEDAKQDNESDNTFNATLTQRMENSILVSCPTYEDFDVINLTMTEDTVIEFEDGSEAKIDDIQGDLTITILDVVSESYPPQGTAMKVIIREQ